MPRPSQPQNRRSPMVDTPAPCPHAGAGPRPGHGWYGLPAGSARASGLLFAPRSGASCGGCSGRRPPRWPSWPSSACWRCASSCGRARAWHANGCSARRPAHCTPRWTSARLRPTGRAGTRHSAPSASTRTTPRAAAPSRYRTCRRGCPGARCCACRSPLPPCTPARPTCWYGAIRRAPCSSPACRSAPTPAATAISLISCSPRATSISSKAPSAGLTNSRSCLKWRWAMCGCSYTAARRATGWRPAEPRPRCSTVPSNCTPISVTTCSPGPATGATGTARPPGRSIRCSWLPCSATCPCWPPPRAARSPPTARWSSPAACSRAARHA